MVIRRRLQPVYGTHNYAGVSGGGMRPRSYSTVPTRTPYTSSFSRADSVAYDTRVEDYLLSSRVDDASYLSSAVLDDTYDTAKRSRGRDAKLLRDATNAISTSSSKEKNYDDDVVYGRRRFPRRFGKPGLRKSKKPVFYADPMLHRKSGGGGGPSATSDLMASAAPAPSITRRRYGTRAPSVPSYIDEDAVLSRSVPRLTPTFRAQSLGPPPSRNVVDNHPLLPATRRALPSIQSRLSESKLLGGSRVHAALTPTLTSDYSSPVHPGYDPLYVEYEPDSKPFTRRRPRVLASSLRSPGNYYERLMRKRGKRHGRFGPYYDLESIEGSDLTGVLSDRDSLPDLDGTYDDPDTGVLPSYQHDYSPSSDSPYYVDQDTEYVPFKPKRPLQTKGLFELSPYGDVYDDVDIDDESPSTPTTLVPYRSSSSHAFPSPTTDLKLSTYLPASFTSAALSASSSSLPRVPYRSVVSFSPSAVDNSLAVVPLTPVSPSQQLLDSLVSSSVSRARAALNDLAIPDYHGASLLLSVEGAGIGVDGKKVGFTYTPPPIPLFGRTLAIDNKILGLKPNSVLKPVDNFLAGYIDRMNALRSQLNDRLDKDRSRRKEYGLSAIQPYTPPSRSYTPYTPYTQTYDYVPVKQLSSRRLEHLPVTTFRSQRDDGHTHRVDVFSLGDIRPRLPSSATRAITLPGPTADSTPVRLSVLDKINIKAAIIASKLEPDPLKRRRPKSEFAAAKYRAMRKDHQESIYSGLPSSSGLSASNPPLSSERFRPRSTPNLSKVVIGRAFSQQVVTVPFKQVRKKSRFLGKPVKYFPSPYDFPDPRLHPKRPTETFDKKKGAKGEDDDRSGGGDEVRRSTVKIPDYYATGVDPRNPPVSDLRRRIRRTLNKTRNS